MGEVVPITPGQDARSDARYHVPSAEEEKCALRQASHAYFDACRALKLLSNATRFERSPTIELADGRTIPLYVLFDMDGDGSLLTHTVNVARAHWKDLRERAETLLLAAGATQEGLARLRREQGLD